MRYLFIFSIVIFCLLPQSIKAVNKEFVGRS
ncbi:MAG: hypothetical protein ACI91R_002457, partial [Vicingaceae bacterium]